MKKSILTFVVIMATLLLSWEIKAQDYQHAIGGHFGIINSPNYGLYNGITFKTVIAANKALEFILCFSSETNSSSFRSTGLFETYKNIGITPGLLLYYGYGASVGSRKTILTHTRNLLISLDGVLGLDYACPNIPINLSLDWKAGLEIIPITHLYGGGINMSIRYSF